MSHAEHTWHVPGCWDCEDQADDKSKAELWAQVAATPRENCNDHRQPERTTP